MKIFCAGCGRFMGENDAEPTVRLPVWYGLHDDWGCGSGFTHSESLAFSIYVWEQNRLPRRASALPHARERALSAGVRELPVA